MKRRPLGNHTVRAVGLGCVGMSEFYGDADRKRSIEVIRGAPDRGVDLLDTADMCRSGHNEERVGKAVAGRRDDAFVATKFGVVRGEAGCFQGISGRSEYVRRRLTRECRPAASRLSRCESFREAPHARSGP